MRYPVRVINTYALTVPITLFLLTLACSGFYIKTLDFYEPDHRGIDYLHLTDMRTELQGTNLPLSPSFSPPSKIPHAEIRGLQKIRGKKKIRKKREKRGRGKIKCKLDTTAKEHTYSAQEPVEIIQTFGNKRSVRGRRW